MKKILVALGTVLIMISGVLITPQKSLAASSIDQQSTSGTGSIAILTNDRFSQTFRPAMSKLDKVEVELTQPNGTYECRLAIWSSEGWGTVATTNVTASNGWNTCDYTTDVDVTVGGRYAIQLDTTYSGSAPQWKYSISNPYANGFAIWQANDKPEWDYNFKTYGYNADAGTPAANPETSTDQGTTVTGSALSTTTGSTAGEAPSANTSTSIDKPTNLKAEYATETGKTGAKLTWTASKTADITGYAVFRTETKGKSYAKVGTTDKKTVTYLDATVSASKTYYYMVRAVKSATQSVNSNEASLAIPADAPPAAPVNLKVVSFDTGSISVSWDKSTDASVSSYNISIVTNGQSVTQASLPATSATHAFTSLKPETTYTISLTAINTKGKTSAPASVDQVTAATPKIPLWRWIVGLGLIIALLGIGVYLIIRNHKKKPKVNIS